MKVTKMHQYYLLERPLELQKKLKDDLLLGKQETFLLTCLEEMAFRVSLYACLTLPTLDLVTTNLSIFLIHHNYKLVSAKFAHTYSRTEKQSKSYAHWAIGLFIFLQGNKVRNLGVGYLIGEVPFLPVHSMGSRAN